MSQYWLNSGKRRAYEPKFHVDTPFCKRRRPSAACPLISEKGESNLRIDDIHISVGHMVRQNLRLPDPLGGTVLDAGLQELSIDYPHNFEILFRISEVSL